ncbi:hypothetical protein B0I08_106127 [Glaciihabitans tibetensis]|uniref:Polyketide cyclase/dehydrase/lipid transport protein n=1 Tax=Glaciihabitans tibetensis TaxID=1266600 RepID=A0A2T0VBG5_9MICO|nr:hypothetical protein [Glaciihabitans tibetensis]PRY67520.1 hypothetical protein B0I08_106127 [Glaciihabitans tibetensis]
MRVLLKLVLDCPPDAAWRAIRSPEVFGAVSAPFTRFRSLEADGYPALWTPGDHLVRVSAGGIIPIGDQVIGVSFPEPGDPGTGTRPVSYSGVGSGEVRIMRDGGHGIGGVLGVITRWEHTMVVSDAPGGRTLYRDRLVFEAGRMTPLLWPLYWAFWQWRAFGLRRLAPGWRV